MKKEKKRKPLNTYIHQESYPRSSHISPRMKINFDLKAVSSRRSPQEHPYTLSCRNKLGLVYSRINVLYIFLSFGYRRLEECILQEIE